MSANKVKYGLKNVHYALVTETVSSGVTTSSYGTVKAWPGAVSLSMSSSASKSVFRADDSDYFVTYGEGGYEGDLETALIPEDITVTLSDRSEGMLRDARRKVGPEDPRFSFQVFDASRIPFPDDSFDLVIANHVLFYCEDIPAVSCEIARVLKKDGLFVCSTYGSAHMQEITRFVQQFDERISLSAEHLYDRFGRENGASVLSESFPEITWQSYEDHLMVTEPEPLIAYILSCHGNQNQYILDRYKDFHAMAVRQTKKGFYITKDAGAFLCRTDKNKEFIK